MQGLGFWVQSSFNVVPQREIFNAESSGPSCASKGKPGTGDREAFQQEVEEREVRYCMPTSLDLGEH